MGYVPLLRVIISGTITLIQCPWFCCNSSLVALCHSQGFFDPMDAVFELFLSLIHVTVLWLRFACAFGCTFIAECGTCLVTYTVLVYSATIKLFP